VVEGRRDPRLLGDHRTDLGTAGDGDVGTAPSYPRKIACELDYIAIALVGDQ
jgi:hypothetical protein